MFGLGLWEWIGILFLAAMLFGPKFLVRSAKSIWGSLTGFATSFKEAAAEEALPGPQRALNPPREHEKA